MHRRPVWCMLMQLACDDRSRRSLFRPSLRTTRCGLQPRSSPSGWSLSGFSSSSSTSSPSGGTQSSASPSTRPSPCSLRARSSSRRPGSRSTTCPHNAPGCGCRFASEPAVIARAFCRGMRAVAGCALARGEHISSPGKQQAMAKALSNFY